MTVALRLHLGGPEGGIAGDAFLEAASAVLDLLSEAARGAPQRPTWTIHELSGGSAEISFAASGEPSVEEVGDRAVSVVLVGLHELAELAAIPPGFSERMTRKVGTLAGALGRRGVRSVAVEGFSGSAPYGSFQISERVGRHAEQALSGTSEALGSVRGVLDRLNLRGGRSEVGLVDVATNAAVTCTFPDELWGRVQRALSNEIEAWGVVRRNATGQKISMVMEDFELVQPAGRPKPVESFVGTFPPGWKGADTSAQWVRRQRGA